MYNFQSTPPHRWRHMNSTIWIRCFYLSIHSTTQVETVIGERWDFVKVFQSTPPHRWRRYFHVSSLKRICLSIHSTTQVETVADAHGSVVVLSFQSTPPHRWRLPAPGLRVAIFNSFNPLHHTGGDDTYRLRYGGTCLSIHSTTQVETW